MTALARRFREIRQRTEELCAPLSPEDASAQSMPDASPAKWHLAHTTWFFETFVLERELPGHEPFHPAFRVLFNSYYNVVGEQYARPRRGLLTRPALDLVLRYRAAVDERVAKLCEQGALGAQAQEVVELGLQHEQQHQELILTDVKHLFSCNPLQPLYGSAPEAAAGEAPPLRWRGVAEGVREIGAPDAGFAFDNERPRHRAFVHAFEIGSRLVTCGEYLDFVRDGGYARPELWLSDGWAARSGEGWQLPLYWERREGGDAGEEWWQWTLSGARRVRAAEPLCHVSYYEADAFARWAGARLPTEQEWESAASAFSALAAHGNFAEDGLLHPAPLIARPDGAAGAVEQLFGDVWEWTSSAYAPYPGYRPPPGAIGEYNGKFMCNQLVLRGGSCATPRSHARASYRNFFYPGSRWQFSGIRLARDAT
jgi:ergothioneine biosynthesis protein EgtB